MQHSMHEAICNYKAVGAHYCTCLHLVWNVAVTLNFFVYAFQSIEKKVKKYKRITMAQWVNRPRNNSFVKAMQLPLLC